MFKTWFIACAVFLLIPLHLFADDVVIHQFQNGEVVVLGTNDISEIVVIEGQADPAFVRFFVYSIGADGFVDFHGDETFEDVSGVAVLLGEAGPTGYHHVGIRTTLFGLPTIIDGNVEVYSSDQSSFCYLSLGRDTEVAGDVVFETNGLDDRLFLNDATIQGDVYANMGFGGDFIEIQNTVIDGDVNIETGRGVDTIEIQGTVIEGDVTIKTGRDNDTIEIEYTDIYRLDLRTGRDADVVEIHASQLSSTYIDLGSGHDEIEMIDSAFGISTLVKGGNQNDEGWQAGNTFGKSRLFYELICASEQKIGNMEVFGAWLTVARSLASCSAIGRLPGPRTWVAMVNRAQNKAEEQAIRKCLSKGQPGQPYGSGHFVSQSAVRLQLQHFLRPCGRQGNNELRPLVCPKGHPIASIGGICKTF